MPENLHIGWSHRGKLFVFGIVTVVLSVVVTIVIAEIALRVMLPSSDVDLFVDRTDSIRYKVMKPNVSGHIYGVRFETNDEGFHAQKPFQTDRDLDSRSHGRSVEVLNVAVAGHGILHHCATPKEVCFNYDPQPSSFGLNIIDAHPNVEYCSLVADAIFEELRDEFPFVE